MIIIYEDITKEKESMKVLFTVHVDTKFLLKKQIRVITNQKSHQQQK